MILAEQATSPTVSFYLRNTFLGFRPAELRQHTEFAVA